jgi:MarR family transcriptional regulator for hemolysin
MVRRQRIMPIGLEFARTARAVTHAFDRAMADAGASAALWQVLLLVRTERWGTQSRLADAMGVSQATLTHHLAAAERRGLVRRWRDPENRRVQQVELTDDGVEVFERLREVARRHDARLRSQLGDDDTERLRELLGRLRAAVS